MAKRVVDPPSPSQLRILRASTQSAQVSRVAAPAQQRRVSAARKRPDIGGIYAFICYLITTIWIWNDNINIILKIIIVVLSPIWIPLALIWGIFR